jgi:membrane protease YdiL (CAAX protease family)
VLLAFTAFMIPDHLFSLLQKPDRWVMVIFLYPVLSALPQEIIFRSFIFRRFAPLFTPTQLSIASALAFGWAHIILMNWVAVVFSFLGGLLFTDTYRKTRSLAAVCFEHALYGCYIFTIGLGFYFYHGNAVK